MGRARREQEENSGGDHYFVTEKGEGEEEVNLRWRRARCVSLRSKMVGGMGKDGSDVD